MKSDKVSTREDKRYHMPVRVRSTNDPVFLLKRNSKNGMDDFALQEMLTCPRDVETFTSGDFTPEDCNEENQEGRERRHKMRRAARRYLRLQQ